MESRTCVGIDDDNDDDAMNPGTLFLYRDQQLAVGKDLDHDGGCDPCQLWISDQCPSCTL
jgi:hypothetical protein